MKNHSARLRSSASRPDPQRLAEIRDAFQSSGRVVAPRLVADPVQASWFRSKLHAVDVERVKPVFLPDFNTQTQFSLSATPVLRQLADELSNEPVSIILTDAKGLVLQRLSSESRLTRALEGAGLSPGFNYAEQHVGTNGIGTALERRAPTLIDGAEHYTRDLGAFSCAGVPILHPISGALLGILDLTSLARDANPLLLVVAKSTAHRIQQQLLSQANASELALFADYLSATRHGEDCILAVGQNLTILSAHTQRHFDANDRAAILARSADVAGLTEPSTLLADLPSGHTARMDYRPVFAGLGLAGGVFRIQRAAEKDRSVRVARPAVFLPGVVGESAIWQRASRAVDTSCRRGEWVVLDGEPGVGKLSLLRGVHQLRSPDAPFRIIDAADILEPAVAGLSVAGLSAFDPVGFGAAGPGLVGSGAVSRAQAGFEVWLDEVSEAMAAEGGTIVLRHVHLLSTQAITELSALLLEAAPGADSVERPWLTMTMNSELTSAEVHAQLLPHFPQTIEIPPLRQHMDDLRVLVPHLLGRVQRQHSLAVSSSALDQLMRLTWRGNVEQLQRILVKVARLRRTGTITVDDLPAECRATSGRQFTQMEALERDAVVRALLSHNGSKDRAAGDLGVSRSTIYRKIREFGIILAADHNDLG